MYFKQLEENENPLLFIEKVKTEVGLHADDMIGEQIALAAIPSLRYGKKQKIADEHWLQHVFNLKFVYWPEEHLLGLSGYHYPGITEQMFDTHFCFQNSSDQD